MVDFTTDPKLEALINGEEPQSIGILPVDTVRPMAEELISALYADAGILVPYDPDLTLGRTLKEVLPKASLAAVSDSDEWIRLARAAKVYESLMKYEFSETNVDGWKGATVDCIVMQPPEELFEAAVTKAIDVAVVRSACPVAILAPVWWFAVSDNKRLWERGGTKGVRFVTTAPYSNGIPYAWVTLHARDGIEGVKWYG